MQYLSKRSEHTRCVSLTRFSRDCCERPQLVVAGIGKRELVLVLIGPSTLPSKRPVNRREAHRVFQNREATSPSLHIEEVVQWTINFRGWVLWREAAKCFSGYVMCEVILPYRSLSSSHARFRCSEIHRAPRDRWAVPPRMCRPLEFRLLTDKKPRQLTGRTPGRSSQRESRVHTRWMVSRKRLSSCRAARRSARPFETWLFSLH